MRSKLLFILSCFILLAACGPIKPELADTQVVNGESIVLPPNFNHTPKEK